MHDTSRRPHCALSLCRLLPSTISAHHYAFSLSVGYSHPPSPLFHQDHALARYSQSFSFSKTRDLRLLRRPLLVAVSQPPLVLLMPRSALSPPRPALSPLALLSHAWFHSSCSRRAQRLTRRDFDQPLSRPQLSSSRPLRCRRAVVWTCALAICASVPSSAASVVANHLYARCVFLFAVVCPSPVAGSCRAVQPVLCPGALAVDVCRSLRGLAVDVGRSLEV
jgi:hypothetical protein